MNPARAMCDVTLTLATVWMSYLRSRLSFGWNAAGMFGLNAVMLPEHMRNAGMAEVRSSCRFPGRL